MSEQKYFRTVFEIEYLSDMEPPSFPTLAQIEYDITEGHASGVVNVIVQEEVTKERMAELLIAQGSDPEFLIPEEDEDGSS